MNDKSNWYWLNDRQKQFLFDKGYVTAKVLYADTREPDWQRYFIKRFKWSMYLPLRAFVRLDINAIDISGYCYKDLWVNFTDADRRAFFALED